MLASQPIGQFLSAIASDTSAHTASAYLTHSSRGGALFHQDALPAIREFANTTLAAELLQSAMLRDSTGQLFTLLVPEGGVILGAPVADLEIGTKPDEERRKSRSRDNADAIWLAFRFADETNAQAFTDRIESDPGFAKMLVAGCVLLWHVHTLSSLASDPVTGLPGRVSFESQLHSTLEACLQAKKRVALVLINPDDFGTVNQHFGREHGDGVVRDMAIAMRECLRQSDQIYRHGSLVFAVLLEDLNDADLNTVLGKLQKQLSARGYQDGSVRLSFSLGAAVAEADKIAQLATDPYSLVSLAEAALTRCKLDGGNRTVLFRRDTDHHLPGAMDPLGGLFTADVVRDHRNMLLLWETFSLVASSDEPREIAEVFLRKLIEHFSADIAGVFHQEDNNMLMLAHMPDESRQAADWSSAISDELARVWHSRATRASTQGYQRTWIAPLRARERLIACVALSGAELSLDDPDIRFLEAVCAQVAVALEHAEMLSHSLHEQEIERTRLYSELRELRSALDQSKLIYQSEQMTALISNLEKIAPSDATVLITGESGTGKEVIASTTHAMSHRHEKPLVIVDCASIPETLLEAELFGREKGAYTGATEKNGGRILEADGGTLFLDEIGELPLEAQAKLLRFVQEKTFNPVGGNRQVQVDVRILAATNRDLQQEVSAGRFRGDLFYRLKVVELSIPPLRERRADILPIAHYFLRRFNAQYARTCVFSEAAETQLVTYSWPGNVRELQHSILRSVLMAEADEIQPEALTFTEGVSLEGSGPGQQHISPERLTNSRVLESDARHAPEPDHYGRDSHISRGSFSRDSGTAPAAESQVAPEQNIWAVIGTQLENQVADAVETAAGRLPLGKWLTDDLIEITDEISDGVTRRGADVVGMPESTYRRNLQRVTSDRTAGLRVRSESWHKLQELLRQAVKEWSATSAELPLHEYVRSLLMSAVATCVGDDHVRGAALMGVTTPTYRRHLVKFEPDKGSAS